MNFLRQTWINDLDHEEISLASEEKQFRAQHFNQTPVI